MIRINVSMLRLWVTLYYGYWLFLVGLSSLAGVRGQGPTPTFEIPDTAWWRGNAITFIKYRNDPSCRQIAVPGSDNGYGFNQNGGWFGGADKITFLMNSTSCIRVSTHRGEWAQVYFNSGSMGCGVNAPGGGMMDIRYFNHPECRQNEWQNIVYGPSIGPLSSIEGTCWADRGAGGVEIYYRYFCDVAKPAATVTNAVTNVFPVTNLTRYVHTTNNITQYVHTTNNITTYVPTIVRPDDLIPLIETLMKRNASMFKVQNVLGPISPPASPETTTPPLVKILNSTANEPKRSSAADIIAHGSLWALLFLATYFRYSLYTFCSVYPRCLP